MNVAKLNVTPEAALDALLQYKEHRNAYDSKDWEIERIYRAISKGKIVISAMESIRKAGFDERGRPRLAICQAHAVECICHGHGDRLTFGIAQEWDLDPGQGKITVPWQNSGYPRCRARLPRIPPQYRPAANSLGGYHLLWEADWIDVPRDPMLLRRIGRDAWVVLAAWDLTDVEMNVLRAPRNQ